LQAAGRKEIESQDASIRLLGERDPDTLECLAMAAVAAGLPPWSQENDREIRTCRQVIGAVTEATGAKGEAF